MDDCVFCKIVEGQIPANKIYETDDVLAFWDVNPKAPVHILIIPKRHVVNLSEAIAVDEGLVDNVMLGVTKVAELMKISEGYKATTNNGEAAGQVVSHFHFHVLGGWKDRKDIVSEVQT